MVVCKKENGINLTISQALGLQILDYCLSAYCYSSLSPTNFINYIRKLNWHDNVMGIAIRLKFNLLLLIYRCQHQGLRRLIQYQQQLCVQAPLIQQHPSITWEIICQTQRVRSSHNRTFVILSTCHGPAFNKPRLIVFLISSKCLMATRTFNSTLSTLPISIQ